MYLGDGAPIVPPPFPAFGNDAETEIDLSTDLGQIQIQIHCTHLLTVLGFGPSSAQHSVVGLPVEMMQSAVSRLNSSVYLAAGLDMAYRPLGRR